MRTGAVASILALILLGPAGCASDVVRFPVELSGAELPAARYVVVQPVEVLLDSGYQRKIDSGMELAPVGKVKQGDVFRPTTSVITVEGAHMHEAYLVLAGGRLVGFYLPVEKAFAPLSRPVALSIQKRGASR